MFCQRCNDAEQLQLENTPDVLPLGLNGVSLETCLEYYFSPDEIDRVCSHCQSQRSTQVVSFITNPATFIIQLNRFELNRTIKKHDDVIIPHTLQLPGGTTYRLSSIINHLGETPNSGHYTCLLAEPSGDTFTLVDDTTVRRSVRMTEEMSRTGYILMYTIE